MLTLSSRCHLEAKQQISQLLRATHPQVKQLSICPRTRLKDRVRQPPGSLYGHHSLSTPLPQPPARALSPPTACPAMISKSILKCHRAGLWFLGGLLGAHTHTHTYPPQFLHGISMELGILRMIHSASVLTASNLGPLLLPPRSRTLGHQPPNAS